MSYLEKVIFGINKRKSENSQGNTLTSLTMKKEIRNLEIKQAEIRADSKTGIISGYAMVFNSLSELLFGRFYERILPEAMNGVVEISDVLALLNHQKERGILARSRFGKGTLSLKIDDKGLRYKFTPPDTALGKEAREYLKRGDIQGSSFHFVLANKGENWEKTSDGKYIRTITKFSEIYDVSLAFTPAYPETTAAVRSLEVWEKEQQTPKQKLKLEKYYQDYDKKIRVIKS